jgi:hypothetical protein
MKINNKVHSLEFIPWQDLKSFEFNNLKEKIRDINNLKNNIVNNGFTSPFYMWHEHRYVIDGMGRQLALTELEAEGYEIPELPVVMIQTENKKEVLKIVMSINSKFGDITKESFDEFIKNDFEMEELKQLQETELSLNHLNLVLEDFISEDIDYSILDNEELEKQIENLADGVKKAIQIEFNPSDYERAYELCKYARNKKVYIGEHLINKLQDIKDQYEDEESEK